MPEAGLVLVRPVYLDVDEVPLPRRVVAHLRRAPVGVAIAVGPRSAARDILKGEGIVVGGQQGIEALPRDRCQELLRDERDGHVALVAPGVRHLR